MSIVPSGVIGGAFTWSFWTAEEAPGRIWDRRGLGQHYDAFQPFLRRWFHSSQWKFFQLAFPEEAVEFYPPESPFPIPKLLKHLYQVPTQTWGGPGELDGFQGKWVQVIQKWDTNRSSIWSAFSSCSAWFTPSKDIFTEGNGLRPYSFGLNASCGKTGFFLFPETLVPGRLMADGSRGWSWSDLIFN